MEVYFLLILFLLILAIVYRTEVLAFVRNLNKAALITGEGENFRYTPFTGKILMVGFGAIAIAVLPLMMRHLNVSPTAITIVTADRRNEFIAKEFNIPHIVDPVTPRNIKKLSKYLHPGGLLLNLSVDVSSVELFKLAQENNCVYVDSCIEPWAGGYSNGELSERTNYALREKALKHRAVGKPTALLAMGANPGLISLIYKDALLEIARSVKLKSKTPHPPKTQEEWGMLAHDLGVKVVQIAERDTQIPKEPKKPDTFINTWSADGFISEGIYQPAEAGWGTHEKELPPGAHTLGPEKRAIYFDRPGAREQIKSWTPKNGAFRANLVTHNEAISISEYFSVKSNGKIKYCPTVYYAYHPCDAALVSLDEMIGLGHEQSVRKVLKPEEIMSGGMDELGVLVMGDSGVFWHGSQLTIDEAVKLCPYNSATTMQVSIGVFVGICWVLENRNLGVIEPEEIDHTFAMKIARPYLGKYGLHKTDWHPLAEIDGAERFKTPLDKRDLFQYKNFTAF